MDLMFEIIVLAIVGVAYVIFEAVLTRSEPPRDLRGAGGAQTPELVGAELEAYRPISSWSSTPKLDD